MGWIHIVSGAALLPVEDRGTEGAARAREARAGRESLVQSQNSPEKQAEYVKIALKIFATYPHVMGSFFYDWGDDPTCYHCGQKGCPSECGWGMVDSEGKPKPAYHAFKEIAAQYY